MLNHFLVSTRRVTQLTNNSSFTSIARMMSSAASGYSYETLSVTKPKDYVLHVEMNRPDKLNSMNKTFWREIGECFNQIDLDPDCRSVVLTGAGRLFTAGIDLTDFGDIVAIVMGDDDIARKGKAIKTLVKNYQESFSALEKCSKPVIAAVHNACIGGGVDMICAADIRYCSSDSYFCIKEIDIGLAADVGTLQRMPKVIGSESLMRELAFTGRKMFADEALKVGFVNRVFGDRKSLLDGAISLATTIASKSPVALQATKQTMVHARDHSVQEGLNFVAQLNMAMLQSEDVKITAMAGMGKKDGKNPVYAKL